MNLFKRKTASAKTASVHVGECFVKAGDHAGRAWKVTRLWTTEVGIPHAQIENNCQRKESRIIAVSALTDMNFYGPAADAA
jgi:hypothetical protein